jgi:hypothetical protein
MNKQIDNKETETKPQLLGVVVYSVAHTYEWHPITETVFSTRSKAEEYVKTRNDPTYYVIEEFTIE